MTFWSYPDNEQANSERQTVRQTLVKTYPFQPVAENEIKIQIWFLLTTVPIHENPSGVHILEPELRYNLTQTVTSCTRHSMYMHTITNAMQCH